MNAVPLYFSAKSISQSRKANRKPQSLLVATRHNLRDKQAEQGASDNIDLNRSHLNVTLHGPSTPHAIVERANELKIKYAVPKSKLRKDHVQALEFVISVRDGSDIDVMAYFNASLRWLIKVFGAEMLLSAVVHLDEAEPHMHGLVLPILNGEYRGSSLIDKPSLQRLTRLFAEEVGKPFGLSFQPKRRLHAAQRTAAFNLVIDHLQSNADPVLRSLVWPPVLEHIKREPQNFLQTLNLEVPNVARKTHKSFTEIMTGTGKRTSEDRDRCVTHNLSSVGKRDFTPPFSVEGAHA
jgi:hypothetical protein